MSGFSLSLCDHDDDDATYPFRAPARSPRLLPGGRWARHRAAPPCSFHGQEAPLNAKVECPDAKGATLGAQGGG